MTVLLSLQRALVGEIHPAMRGVTVEIAGDRVHVTLFLDPDAADEVAEDFDAGALSQVVGDLPWPGPTLTWEAVRADPAQRLPQSPQQIWVFGRVDMGALTAERSRPAPGARP